MAIQTVTDAIRYVYGNRFYSIIWLRSNLFILPQAVLELLLIDNFVIP